MRAHAKLIKKWLDDGNIEIEMFSHNSKWEVIANPSFQPSALYREKPKAKKLVSKWLWVLQDGGDRVFAGLYYFDTIEAASKYYPFEVICKIEGSKIEVEE